MSQPNFSTNISSNTPVAGVNLGAGETINEVQLGWILIGSDDSGLGTAGLSTANQTQLQAAYSTATIASRTVIFLSSNATAVIAAIQTTAGYTYAVTLAAGTYVPIIRWWKNLVGGGLLAGITSRGLR